MPRGDPPDVEAVLSETAQVRSDEVIDVALLGDNEALETGLDRLRSEAGLRPGCGPGAAPSDSAARHARSH
jgi:hypothetical protein